MASQVILTGDKELDEALEILAGHKKARSISRSGLGAYLTVCKKGIKSATPGSMKDLRKDIGQRIMPDRANKKVTIGKVGYAVGKGGKAMQEPKVDRGGRPGKGISGRNVHWWIMGTTDRHTGSIKGKPTGKPVRYTGKMPALSPPGPVETGMAAVRGQAVSAMRERIAKRIEAETNKLKGKK